MFMLVSLIHVQLHAQEADSTTGKGMITESRLKLGKIESYWLTVTYEKTTHIIFPSKIKYVDLGSENVIAGKAESSENVLRIKAAVRDFESETNFSVITEDGKFYSFDVFYSKYPASLNYDVLKMLKSQEKDHVKDVLFEDMGSSAPSLSNAALKTIYVKNKKLIRHIGSYSFGISFFLKGIYIYAGKYYFHTELKNTTNVPYPVDFMTFKIIERKTGKLTAIQEIELVPLRSYFPITDIAENSSERNVFVLDQFTLADDKMLVIEVFERNGGRNQRLEILNDDLIHASLVKNLKLNF